MKWLGQYIQDFTSRFRNDVYLDDIATGTIASGGNLGLDSNNKIVKASVSGSSGIAFDGSTANGVLTYKDSDEATVESNLTYDGTDLTAVSSSEGKPVLTLKTTHTTKTSSAELQFLKDAADTEDGENLGVITFYGEDEGNNNTKFAHIKGSIQESDEGAEGGSIKLAVATHDGEMVNGLVVNDGNSEDEIDVTIGSTATSVTTVAGTLTMGSTATINNSGVIQVAAQTVIDHDQLANYAANEHFTQANITTVGTIGTGVWQGTAIASAYLDSDTAHLAGPQTFTGNKTFGAPLGTQLTIDGNTAVEPGDGVAIHVDASDVTDSATSASGTANSYTHVNIEAPRLLAVNSSVTTSDAATFYVKTAPSAGTNQTITRAWSMWIDNGNARFDGSIYSGTTESLNSSGLLTVANQSNITGLGTISSGTWQGTSIATAYTAAKVTSIVAGDGIDVSGATGDVTVTAETATDSNPGVVELATTAEATTGTDTARAVTPAGVKAVHATTQTGKNYRIINTSFRDDIGTTKHYLPLKSQDEQTALTREEGTELAVCDGRVVSITYRGEQFADHTGDATITFGIETNTVGSAYSSGFSSVETENITVNHTDDNHIWHVVFDSAKHWDSTDMFAISIQSDTDTTGSNERHFITVVIEDDWSTYLGIDNTSTTEIDTTP
tara:strand:+ start:284 stop:2290 length:2007 start_codon:yes stop_codon:yes gene_type:complete